MVALHNGWRQPVASDRAHRSRSGDTRSTAASIAAQGARVPAVSLPAAAAKPASLHHRLLLPWDPSGSERSWRPGVRARSALCRSLLCVDAPYSMALHLDGAGAAGGPRRGAHVVGGGNGLATPASGCREFREAVCRAAASVSGGRRAAGREPALASPPSRVL